MKQLKAKSKTKRWSEGAKPRSGGRWAVSPPHAAQPVGFRPDKTELVYSEKASERSISSEHSGDSRSQNADRFQGF